MSPENPHHENAGGKSLRLLRPSVVVLCGPAGCGKSTFAERHFRPTQIISSDWARARICDDERDQRYNEQAFGLAHFLVEQRLRLNRLCVVDSTALTADARRSLLELAKKFEVPSTLIVFNAPLDKCIERDARRARSIGAGVIERQYRIFEEAKGSIHGEGFGQVVELQDGDWDDWRVDVLFRPVARTPPRVDRPAPDVPHRVNRPAQPSRPASRRPENGPRSAPNPLAPPNVQPASPPQRAGKPESILNQK